jgi:uncharacterized protein (TIGR00730 family)
MKRLTVYCASSPKIHSDFFEDTKIFGEEIVKNNIEVYFGGGSKGLMGTLADTILENGGKIKGIMPHFMNEVEWGHKKVDNFEYTHTMAERKAKLIEDVDGVVTLAGGCGTLEELMEVITLKRLGLFTKPIVILNTRNYYAPLKQMLEKCVEENFMNEIHESMWTFVNDPKDIIPALKNSPSWDAGAIRFAEVR